MGHGLVHMPVRMRLTAPLRGRMLVLMVLVVKVRMLVLERFVNVPVRMPLGEQ